jgi:hypothetical protein
MVGPSTHWNFLAGIFFLMVTVLFIHLGVYVPAVVTGLVAVIELGETLRKLL